MQLIQVTGKSKKTGKPYTGYRVKIGEFEGPIFFPSKIELMYIKSYMKKLAHKDFKDSDDSDLGDDDEQSEND